jgi:DNA primase catalytic core
LTGFYEETGMARIPESEIERIKREVSVERLVESSGVKLKKVGHDLKGRCPFHADATPSLSITPTKNLWRCFGCDAGGGPIDWVMKTQGVSFRHAYELLKNDLPPALGMLGQALAAARPVKDSTVPKLAPPVAFDADDAALLSQVVGYYHDTLKASPEALAYLKGRGLDHPELIDTFKLGFANRTLGLRLPEKNRVAGGRIRTRLQSIGLYRASGHEHFNGSLVVPVFDEAGRVAEIYGRKIGDARKLTPGTPLHLYLPGPHRGVWNVEALRCSAEIILCEALIDAMTFWCAGYRNVTAAYGTGGFTDDHLAAFKQYGTKRVLIAYDRDEAGENAVPGLAEKLIAAGIECWRIQFPKGMDANDYALKVTPAAKSLGMAIRKALWLGKGAAPEREIELCAAPVPGLLPAPGLPPAGAGLAGLEKRMDTGSQADDPLHVEAVSSLAAAAAKEKTSDAPALPASPVPPAPASDTQAEVRENEIVMTFGERRYRVRGLAKNLSYDVLKVNVMVSSGERFHVDTLDLCAARQRTGYVNLASIELQVKEDILKADLGRVLLKLEALQDDAIRRALEPKLPAAVQMSDAARSEAMALLADRRLLDRILADFEACGIVGEDTNKLTGYLAAVSRKLERPLAVVIQSSSAAGKSSLMDAVLAFVPEEERVKYSAMTGQSLFYMGETNLKHKILAIVEEEGASRASYALKLLQSEGELTIASTGKDPATGNLITQQYRVEGPVMIFLTTTASEIDEELTNRCLILSVDEGRAQTEAIHQLQRARRTLQGLIARQERESLIQLHRNAQRLLRPLFVVNPFAGQLTFLSDKTRTRRDHEKYLTLIDTIALLHQHQREIKTAVHHGQAIEYVEVTLDDIARANALAHEVLGRSLDELPPQTRRLLGEIVGLVRARAQAQQVRVSDVHFTRKQVRDHVGWTDFQMKTHMHKLEELEYVLVYRSGRGQSFEYELLYDGEGQDGKPFVMGLIDPGLLRAGAGVETLRYDGDKEHQKPKKEHPSSPQAGTKEHPSSAGQSAQTQALVRVSGHSSSTIAKKHVSKGNGKDPSYPAIPLAALPHA